MKANSGWMYAILIWMLLISGAIGHAEIDLDTLGGAWLFDEGKGKTVKDHSGNGNDGTIMGDPKWIDSDLGPALKFDGSDDYLEIPHSDTVNVGENDFTLVAWLNPAAPGGGNGIISKGAWCWNGGWILDIGDTGPGAIRLESSANGADNGSIISPAGTMDVDKWQFVAVSVTRDADSFIYRDGEEVAVKVIKGNDLTQEAYSLLMGCLLECNKLPGGFFPVSITHVALFNGVALTFEETEIVREQGLEVILPVSPKAKLAISWGKLKAM
jgi:hypothetical protein